MSVFAIHSSCVRWTHLISVAKLCFPSHHYSIIPSVNFLHSKCTFNAQLLFQLSSLVSHSNDCENGSKILKKLRGTKSTEEVLLLTSSQQNLSSSEISTSLQVLVQHKYSSLSSACWSYYNSQREMWVQTNINSDIKSGFMPLLNSPDFCQLCQHLWDLLPQLSNNELLTCLHSLLRLHFPLHNELNVQLQQLCLQKCHQFDLSDLVLYTSIANMLQRNGFAVNSVICSRFQEIMATIELHTDEDFSDLVNILFNLGFFLSSRLVEAIMLKISDFIKNSSKEIEPVLLLYCLEILFRHSEKINNELLEILYSHFYEAVDTMEIHNLRKLVSLLRAYGCLHEDFKKLCTTRALDILSNGFLRASDVVSLINIFDACGWTQNVINEVEDLLLIHIHEFDILALKHTSGSKFLYMCQNSILNEFSERVSRKLSDLSNSLSCLLSVAKFYSRACYRNVAFHFKLRNLFLEQIHTEQRVFRPSHLRVFYEYILNTTKKVPSVALNGITDSFHQFTFKDIVSIAGSLNKMNFKQMSVSEECLIGNLKDVLRKNVFQRQHEISNIKQLVILDRCSLLKLHSSNDMVSLSKLYDRLAPSVDLETLKMSCLHLKKHMLYFPTTLQYFCNFACENREELHTDTLLCLLETCAVMNFVPQNFIDLQEVCLSRFGSINDGFCFGTDIMLISHLIRLAHSFAILGHFPPHLLKSIFSVEFIKLFDELSTEPAWKKELFVEKLLELNRCVVLESFDFNIPWFHEDVKNIRESHFHSKYDCWKDIATEGLTEALGGTEYLKTSRIVCPYNYNIDIECYLTMDGRPVQYRDVDKLNVYNGIRRLAVIILQPHHMFCNEMHLLGQTEVKKRHLEILGYEVVMIPYQDLDSLNSTNKEKCTYFKQKLCLER